MRKWIFLYSFPPVLYGGLIFFLSSISKYPESIPSFWGFDKVLHFSVYYVFGLLLMRMFANAPWRSLVQYAALLAVAAGILYGVTDEIHQSLVPGRMATVSDAVFDGLGVVLAAYSYRFALRRWSCG